MNKKTPAGRISPIRRQAFFTDGPSARQIFSHLEQQGAFPAGNLHLRHTELVRRGLLGMPIEIPQHDESPIPGIQLPQHLLEGQMIGDAFLRRGNGDVDLIAVVLLPRPGQGKGRQ